MTVYYRSGDDDDVELPQRVEYFYQKGIKVGCPGQYVINDWQVSDKLRMNSHVVHHNVLTV